MSRPHLQVASHLSYTEITRQYETCCNDQIKTYWQMIRLLSQQDPCLSVKEVADRVQFSTDWVRKLVNRYNRLGPIGLTGKRLSQHQPRS
ncbi:helix-turn-helix domain-containing protein [Pantanalinema sp. GBBB05]|uniref:helix-turn-helix domain-containing protein n=1 Tax=Pantanalinema sp. GBBB05 TaxID=2604139 RepID=UPI001D9FEEFF|nr:helix-turn-helix domain-containing protein [Pantanalinema sp. GBBB05]